MTPRRTENETAPLATFRVLAIALGIVFATKGISFVSATSTIEVFTGCLPEDSEVDIHIRNGNPLLASFRITETDDADGDKLRGNVSFHINLAPTCAVRLSRVEYTSRGMCAVTVRVDDVTPMPGHVVRVHETQSPGKAACSTARDKMYAAVVTSRPPLLDSGVTGSNGSGHHLVVEMSRNDSDDCSSCELSESCRPDGRKTVLLFLEDIDECTNVSCANATPVCSNTFGSYRCCRTSGCNDPTRDDHCKVDRTCPALAADCQNRTVCLASHQDNGNAARLNWPCLRHQDGATAIPKTTSIIATAGRPTSRDSVSVFLAVGLSLAGVVIFTILVLLLILAAKRWRAKSRDAITDYSVMWRSMREATTANTSAISATGQYSIREVVEPEQQQTASRPPTSQVTRPPQRSQDEQRTVRRSSQPESRDANSVGKADATTNPYLTPQDNGPGSSPGLSAGATASYVNVRERSGKAEDVMYSTPKGIPRIGTPMGRTTRQEQPSHGTASHVDGAGRQVSQSTQSRQGRPAQADASAQSSANDHTIPSGTLEKRSSFGRPEATDAPDNISSYRTTSQDGRLHHVHQNAARQLSWSGEQSVGGRSVAIIEPDQQTTWDVTGRREAYGQNASLKGPNKRAQTMQVRRPQAYAFVAFKVFDTDERPSQGTSRDLSVSSREHVVDDAFPPATSRSFTFSTGTEDPRDRQTTADLTSPSLPVETAQRRDFAPLPVARPEKEERSHYERPFDARYQSQDRH